MTGIALIHPACGIPYAEHDNRSPDTVSPWGCPKEDTVTQPPTTYCNKAKGQVQKITGYPYSHVVKDTKGSDQPCYCDKLVQR